MRALGYTRIATLVASVLFLLTCCVVSGVSSVLASGQRGSIDKALGAKPIVIEARPDRDVRVTSGWKLFLVGTNEYDNLGEKYDLHYAVKDVQSLKSQFIVLGVPEENITILTSQRGRVRANQKTIQKSFNDFVAGLTRNDSAFVCLSGHGFQFDGDDDAYFAPADIDPDDIRGTGVSIGAMQKQLAQSSAKFKWMMVDACRNDPVKDSSFVSRDLPSGVSSAFIVNPSDLPDAFVFMQGCGKGQCSLESSDLEQGLLTYALLEALQCDDNPAAHNEASGKLAFNELIDYVQKRTPELARQRRDGAKEPYEQEPRITCSQLPSFILLTNLRREGLTTVQWDEIHAFEQYLENSDVARAEASLQTIANFLPEGKRSERYKEFKARLQEIKSHTQNRKEAEEKYLYAQNAFDSQKYAMAKVYIDEAIKFHNDTKYIKFRNDLTFAVKAEVMQAISDGNLPKAESLNRLLSELDAPLANENKPLIAAMRTTVTPSTVTAPPEPDIAESNSESSTLTLPTVTSADGSEPGDVITLTIAGVAVNFHWVPAGTYTVGSAVDEENHLDDEPRRMVLLTKGYWIAETETTQELWEAVTCNNPSSFQDSNQLPVESVSWEDCRYFVQTLNSNHSVALPRGYKYAMPTDAQWEVACRAGTTTPFSFGSTLHSDEANCRGAVVPNGTGMVYFYPQQTTRVKSYAPNAWGLYDMHGNVAEWCQDYYDFEYYKDPPMSDPIGPSSGSTRVVRGGSWSNFVKFCRSAFRIDDDPYYTNLSIGFRLVLVQDVQP